MHSGLYGNVALGLSAQAELARAYLASEIKAASLRGEGESLIEYLQSEFFANIDPTPLEGLGHANITRTLVNEDSSTDGLVAGVIRAGTPIARAGNQGHTPTVESAEYVTLDDAYFGTEDTSTTESNGEYTHVQTVSNVPIRATRPGTHASTPVFLEADTPHLVASLAGETFETESTWSVEIRCAGGMVQIPDQQIRQLAPYLGQGSFGPTAFAGIAGALSYPGVRYAAYRRNEASGSDQVFVADAGWGSSEELCSRVFSHMRDNQWIGFGARVRVRGVNNLPIIIRPSVVLRNEDYIGDKRPITDALMEAAQAYFDDRPDWYTWKRQTLRAALTAATRKILTVPAVTVVSRDGATQFEPDSTIDEFWTPTHYYLVGVEPTYRTT